MQQKSHEILSGKCEEGSGSGAGSGSGSGDDDAEADDGDERHARLLLAAAEEALSADWPRDHELPVSAPVGSISVLVELVTFIPFSLLW